MCLLSDIIWKVEEQGLSYVWQTSTAADSWKPVSGNALFSFMTDGFWNFETRTANKWGSTSKKRKRQENTMIHWHSISNRCRYRCVFNYFLYGFWRTQRYCLRKHCALFRNNIRPVVGGISRHEQYRRLGRGCAANYRSVGSVRR